MDYKSHRSLINAAIFATRKGFLKEETEAEFKARISDPKGALNIRANPAADELITTAEQLDRRIKTEYDAEKLFTDPARLKLVTGLAVGRTTVEDMQDVLDDDTISRVMSPNYTVRESGGSGRYLGTRKTGALNPTEMSSESSIDPFEFFSSNSVLAEKGLTLTPFEIGYAKELRDNMLLAQEAGGEAAKNYDPDAIMTATVGFIGSLGTAQTKIRAANVVNRADQSALGAGGTARRAASGVSPSDPNVMYGRLIDLSDMPEISELSATNPFMYDDDLMQEAIDRAESQKRTGAAETLKALRKRIDSDKTAVKNYVTDRLFNDYMHDLRVASPLPGSRRTSDFRLTEAPLLHQTDAADKLFELSAEWSRLSGIDPTQARNYRDQLMQRSNNTIDIEKISNTYASSSSGLPNDSDLIDFITSDLPQAVETREKLRKKIAERVVAPSFNDATEFAKQLRSSGSGQKGPVLVSQLEDFVLDLSSDRLTKEAGVSAVTMKRYGARGGSPTATMRDVVDYTRNPAINPDIPDDVWDIAEKMDHTSHILDPANRKAVSVRDVPSDLQMARALIARGRTRVPSTTASLFSLPDENNPNISRSYTIKDPELLSGIGTPTRKQSRLSIELLASSPYGVLDPNTFEFRSSDRERFLAPLGPVDLENPTWQIRVGGLDPASERQIEQAPFRYGQLVGRGKTAKELAMFLTQPQNVRGVKGFAGNLAVDTGINVAADMLLGPSDSTIRDMTQSAISSGVGGYVQDMVVNPTQVSRLLRLKNAAPLALSGAISGGFNRAMGVEGSLGAELSGSAGSILGAKLSKNLSKGIPGLKNVPGVSEYIGAVAGDLLMRAPFAATEFASAKRQIPDLYKHPAYGQLGTDDKSRFDAIVKSIQEDTPFAYEFVSTGKRYKTELKTPIQKLDYLKDVLKEFEEQRQESMRRTREAEERGVPTPGQGRRPQR